MPKYRVLKDLPFVKAGEEVEVEETGSKFLLNKTGFFSPECWYRSWGHPLDSGFFEEIKPGRWKPKDDEEYFSVDDCNSIVRGVWKNSGFDQLRYSSGNCFPTQMDCLCAAQKVKELLLKIHEEEV